MALKRGAKVTTADAWWNQRRGEIVEDFEREICMTLVTPADTQGVPVMIMFGGGALLAEAALVAMAFDPRFAVALVGSGEGGAKLHRRNFGEAVETLTAAAAITGWPAIS